MIETQIIEHKNWENDTKVNKLLANEHKLQ